MGEEQNGASLEALWGTEPNFDGQHIRSQAAGKLILFGLLAAVLLAVSLAIGFQFDEIRAKGPVATLAALIFPAVLLFFLLPSFARRLLEWRRVGQIYLTPDPLPGSIGGDVGGSIELGENFDLRRVYKLRLICSRVSRRRAGIRISSGDDDDGRRISSTSDRHERVLWDQEGLAGAEPSATGTRLSFRFSVPGELPQSEPPGSNYVRWRILLFTEGPGPRLQRTFVIPVASTGEEGRTAASIPLSHDALIERHEMTESVTMPAMERTAGGLALEYPMGRNGGSALSSIVFGIILFGAGIFWSSVAADEPAGLSRYFLVAMIWFCFGCVPLLVLGAIVLFFNGLTVTVDRTSIAARRRLFGIPLKRTRHPSAELAGIELKVSGRMQVGDKPEKRFFSVIAKGSPGWQATLGGGISDPAVAERVRTAILRAAGHEAE